LHDDLRNGRTDRCVEQLRWLARHDRLTTEDLMIQARVAQLENRLPDAIGALARIDRRDPLAPRALLMLGLIELQQFRARPAEEAFLAALAIDDGLTSARHELVRIYSRQQRPRERDKQFRALAERNALDFTHLRFWNLTRNSSWNPKDDIETLARWVQADSGDHASRLALAEGLTRLGQVAEAEALLGTEPDANPDVRAFRARLAMGRGDLEAAARLVAQGPAEHASLAQLRGQLALSRHDGSGAVCHLRLAHRLDPDNRSVMNSLAIALKLSDQTEAATSLQGAVRRYELLSSYLSRLEGRDAASDVPLLRQVGAACESVGRLSEARAWYHLAIERDPLDKDAQQGFHRTSADRPDLPPLSAPPSSPKAVPAADVPGDAS
jgi:tetratricopeptide (TPR) repeat protein